MRIYRRSARISSPLQTYHVKGWMDVQVSRSTDAWPTTLHATSPSSSRLWEKQAVLLSKTITHATPSHHATPSMHPIYSKCSRVYCYTPARQAILTSISRVEMRTRTTASPFLPASQASNKTTVLNTKLHYSSSLPFPTPC
jgi:hypothetical protein